MNLYCSWTRQSINWDKSSVHFSKNTNAAVRSSLCHILNMKECLHIGSYLDNPFYNYKSKKAIFDRMAAKLAGWKTKNLSLVGRTVLIKAVAIAIPYYCLKECVILWIQWSNGSCGPRRMTDVPCTLKLGKLSANQTTPKD